MRVTIVHNKNRTRKPPHLPSHQWHVVEVCRGKEVSRGKVILVSFFDNRADTIWKVLARDRLVNMGILPNVNFTKKKKRDVKPVISVCSRIIRLTNNQTKSRKRATIPKKEEKATTKMQWLLWKSYLRWVVPRTTRSHCILTRGKQTRGNPMQKVLRPIRRERFTLSTLRQASILEKSGPSLWKIQVKNPYQRSPYAMKFEDRSQEETDRQQRCARRKAWNLVKNNNKLKENDRATFHFSAEEWVLPAASTKEPEERKFVVDSGTGVHRVSKKDLNSAELETMRTTTVMTANGEVQTREEATEIVKELDLFVTVMLLEETPAVLSLGKLCEDRGFSYHWISGQKPHLTKKWQDNWLQCIKLCCGRCLWFISEFLYNTDTYFFNIVITEFCISRQEIHRKSSKRKKWKYEWGVTKKLRCIDQQKPKTRIKMKDVKKCTAIYCMTCRTGCRSSEKKWSIKVVLQS